MAHNDFYVYLHYTKDTGELFYIGKGRRDRARQTKSRRSVYWNRKVEKHGRVVRYYATGLSEELAYQIEDHLVALCGLDSLCNLKAGGGPTAGGYTPTEATRAKLREANLKYNREIGFSPERKANMRAAGLRRMACPKARAQVRDALVEYYKDPSNRVKTSEATKKAMQRPEVKAKLKAYHSSPEAKALKSEVFKRYASDPWNKKKHQKRVYSPTLALGFPSLTDAKEYLREQGWSKALTSKITEACQGKRGTAYKHRWVYV